jgi:hypothetical protein
LVAGLTLPGARAQSASDGSTDGASTDDTAVARPETFAGAASAQALNVALLTPPLIPVEGLFDVAVVEGRGTFESSNQEGRASLLYPGSGILTGPGLLCGTFLGPQIPPEGAPLFGPILEACGQYKYPLTVIVDSLHPDGSTDGALALGSAADPVSLRAVGASAHAASDSTVTRAQATDFKVLGLPALGSLSPLLKLLGIDPLDGSLVSVDGMTARTDQAIVGGRLSVRADTKVNGLRLLGGLVRIGAVTSTSTLLTGGTAKDELSSTLEVGGVTVAGQPAQITEDGLVLAGSSTGPLVQQLGRAANDALQAMGFRIKAADVTKGDDHGVPLANNGGLLIEFTTPLAGLPALPGPIGDLDLNGAYGVRVQVATSGVRGFASSFDDGTQATDGGSDDSGSAFVPSDGFTTDGFGDLPTANPPAVAPSGTTAPVRPLHHTPISDRLADRMLFIYLSFTLGALALCLTPRLTLPARFPGARS